MTKRIRRRNAKRIEPFSIHHSDTSESCLHSELHSELWPSVKICVDINVDVHPTTTSHWVWFLKPQRCGSQTQNVVQKPLRGSQHEFLHVLHHARLGTARDGALTLLEDSEANIT